jgi:hypothetical protein
MNANVVTALAALLGSVAGASAAIATTWISQRSQTRRELAKSEMRKRETLYGAFITEAARLLSDAFDHTLDKPETLVKLYAILGRIRLVIALICCSWVWSSSRAAPHCAVRRWRSSPSTYFVPERSLLAFFPLKNACKRFRKERGKLSFQ